MGFNLGFKGLMAIVRHVISGAGRTKFQAALLLLDGGYIVNHCVQTLSEACCLNIHRTVHCIT